MKFILLSLIILQRLIEVTNSSLQSYFHVVLTMFVSVIHLLSDHVLKLFLVGQRVSEPSWAVYRLRLFWFTIQGFWNYCWVPIVPILLPLVDIYDLRN